MVSLYSFFLVYKISAFFEKEKWKVLVWGSFMLPNKGVNDLTANKGRIYYFIF